MKLVILLCLVASALNYVSSSVDAMGQQIADIIGEDAKDVKQVLPSEDTIYIESQHVDLCGPILCVSANLTNAELTGLSGYDVLKLEFHSDRATVTIDMDLFFPTLKLDSEYYEMKGSIMDALPLAGTGHLYYEAKDFRFWTKIVVQVSDHIYIEKFEDSGFNIKSISSRTEFDGNIDGIFNAMVEELLANHLNRFNKAIAANCGLILKDIINPYL